MEETATKTSSRASRSLLVTIIATAIVAGTLGYVVGMKNAKPAIGSKVPDITAVLPTSKIATDSLITSQEAVAVGKIVKVDAGSITMQGKDGKVGGFKLASKFNIYPLAATNSAAAKPSQDIKSIKLNETYLVHLVLQGTDFVATTIQALPAGTN